LGTPEPNLYYIQKSVIVLGLRLQEVIFVFAEPQSFNFIKGEICGNISTASSGSQSPGPPRPREMYYYFLHKNINCSYSDSFIGLLHIIFLGEWW
jgi:hypothetical protein